MPKKKRGNKKTREEAHQEEASAKHSSLLHISTKTLRKEAKVVKSFQCQKIVKKIKELKESICGFEEKPEINENEKEKAQRKLDTQDKKLKATKAFDIDLVVQVALRRSGLNNDSVSDIDNNNGNSKEGDDGETEKETDTTVNDKDMKEIIEMMIKHKRLASAMTSISEKVSEYNSWLSRREDWLTTSVSNKNKAKQGQDQDPTGGNHHNQNQNRGRKRGRNIDVAGHDGDTGLFIESLSGTAIPHNAEEDTGLAGYEGYQEYGEDDFYEYQKPKKKNRMGQRARKAKQQAIEAKKAGRTLGSYDSVNWREKKSKTKEKDQRVESASGLDKSKKIKVSDVAAMGKNWKEEGKAHPSWAAREAQKAKSGIVAFTGKKITFD